MTTYLLWILIIGGSNTDLSYQMTQPYVVPMKFVHLNDCQTVQKSIVRLNKRNPPRTQCVQVLLAKD